MAFMPYNNVELYINKWLETATKGKVDATFAWGQHRVKLQCNVCDMQLTANVPDTVDKIDYAIQQFVSVHAHVGGHCKHEWRAISGTTGGYQCQRCLMWMHGDAPPPTPVTLDFKKVDPQYPVYTLITTSGTSGTNGLTMTPKIDCKPESEYVIQKQMDKYSKEMGAKSLELELKVKKIQLESATQALQHTKNGSMDLIDQGLITAEQQKALFDKAEELQAQVLAETKAKEQALENLLKIKELQEQLQTKKMEFHDTGHVSKILLGPKTKPLKIATGRKFR